MKPQEYYPVKVFCCTIVVAALVCMVNTASAQNKRIRCYFNHPVNTTISSGFNAVYLNNTFPDTVAAYINRAKYSIDVAMYNFTAFNNSNVAKIATAANAAAARGVIIRWIYNGTSATSNSGLSLLSPLIQTFASANYTDYIMHNKFMVVDVNSADSNDAVVLTGSYNWSDQQTTGDVNNLLFIQSKQVATAFYNEFNKMWGGTAATPNGATAAFSTFKTPSTQTQFNVEGNLIEVYFSPKDAMNTRLQNSINTASFGLFFGVYTFTDNTVANLIKTKYLNGVFVRGIMDEFSQSFNAYATLNPALGNDMLLYTGSNLYHNKTMLIDPLNPSSDPQVFTGSYNWTTQGTVSNDENAVVIHDASIANQYYQSLCKDFTTLGGTPCVAPPCPSGAIAITSNQHGSSYQWQLNTGTGFNNISDTGFYNGSNNINLTLTNAPTSWYGYRFRCVVNGSTYSDTTDLKFTAYWNGSVSTAWENTSNWNCGSLPDANTDVVINEGVKYYPVINNATSCRSVKLNKNAMATIVNGIQLILTGR
ncbi:MAG: hypothetical protein IPP72_20400 [Chitinophagaceae bacterium]|nr:hypothetical protein [Chitinophagaceae bacterium]